MSRAIDDLRERVYRIRALLQVYDECLSKPISAPASYTATNELKVTREELLNLLIDTRKRVNQLASASERKKA